MFNRIVIVFCLMFTSAPAFAAGDWPQFRGPTADGHSAARGVPLTWSETKNLKWKTAIPGQGWSSPVVWDDQIWLTTALDKGKSLRAICVSRDTGAVLHNIELFTPANPGSIHQLNSYASPTPVLDAERAYIHFGNFGIAAVNRKTGSVAWKNEDFKDVVYTVGPGSSPVLYKDLYIVHCDGINQRFLLALDKNTGRVAWKKQRSNAIKKSEQQEKSFATPVLIQHEGKDRLISLHADALTCYDPATGDEIWQIKYEGYSNVCVPLVSNGVVFMNTGYDFPQFWAVKLGTTGEVPKSHVAWKISKGIGPRVSPVLVDELIYLITDDGILQCVDAKTGEQVWKQRIGGQFCASPVYVDGRIYFCDQAGLTTVIAPGDTFKQLAQNKLGDGFMASPAIAGKAMFLRSKSHLYRVEE
jgi:outer membrane protein assembly factor BamB